MSHPRGPFREEHVMQSGNQNTLGTQYDQHTLADQDQGSSLASDATQTRVRTRIEKRERLQRERRIERILTASQTLFSTQAYDEIAIEDLAAAAGMSKGLLYHYFASKRDLYVATVAHVLTQMAHFTDLSPDLHAGLSQMLSLFEQTPGLAKLVLRGGIGVDREVEGLLDIYRQQQLQRLSQSLGFLVDFADVSTDAVGAQALVVLGLRGWLGFLDEVCLQWVQQPDVTREEVVRFLEESLHAIVAATTSPLVSDDIQEP